MVKFDADPLDGPEVDSSDPAGTVKGMAMYIAGAGVFFALLATAQSTVTPAVNEVLGMVPGLQSGEDGSDGLVSFGEVE